ncbi:MAG: shikimate dehydrogenase, partial [Dehalococcoidales bacterium]|nr:shikimate dehydrogenase [Dehalococcoidales bacterium]
TSVGMTPDVNGTPVDASLLRPGMVVVDIVYNPLKTRLLTEAERAGATIVDGLDMFVWQGALALEIWTGQKAPAHIMRQRVIQALRL